MTESRPPAPSRILFREAPWRNVRIEAERSAPERADTRRFLAYCEKKRGRHGTLRSKAIRTEDLGDLAPHLFSARPESDGHWRFATGGLALVARFGVVLAGRRLDDVFDPEAAAWIEGFYDAVIQARAPAGLKTRFSGPAMPEVAMEFAYVPALAEDGRTAMMLGGAFFD